MDRKQFLIILEQVLQTIIKQDAYSFRFIYNKEQDNIKCSFDTNNSNNKLITINVTIQSDNTMNIQVEESDKVQYLSQKQFMANYNKEYQQIKKAIKKFKEQQFNKEYLQKKDPIVKSNNNGVPSINIFNNMLNQDQEDQNIQIIKIKDITFKYNPIQDDKFTDLYQITFDIKNKNIDKDDQNSPWKFLVTIIMKYKPQNSIFLKVILRNLKTESDQELTISKFKEQYQDQYEKLNQSLQIFQKIENKKKNNK